MGSKQSNEQMSHSVSTVLEEESTQKPNQFSKPNQRIQFKPYNVNGGSFLKTQLNSNRKRETQIYYRDQWDIRRSVNDERPCEVDLKTFRPQVKDVEVEAQTTWASKRLLLSPTRVSITPQVNPKELSSERAISSDETAEVQSSNSSRNNCHEMSSREALSQILRRHQQVQPPKQKNMGILRMIDEVSIEESNETPRDSFLCMGSLAEDIRMHRLQCDSVRTLRQYDPNNLLADGQDNYTVAEAEATHKASNQEYFDTVENGFAADYAAVEGDCVDLEMSHFLNEDSYGKTVSIPVVRLGPNTYQIGLLRYSLRTCVDYGLIGANTGMPIHDMIKKIHSKQIQELEQRSKDQDKDWPLIIKEQLVKNRASDEVLAQFAQLDQGKHRLTKVLQKRERGRQFRSELDSSPQASIHRRFH